MMHYLKLVRMEVHRFRYVLAGLAGLTLVLQLLAVWLTTNQRLSELRESNFVDSGAQFSHSKLSFTFILYNTQFMYALPILLSILVLVLYVPGIWYRDWLGRSSFIYRLLALPMRRATLYWSKLTALLLFVFALLGLQAASLPLQWWIFRAMVPQAWQAPSYLSDIIGQNKVLQVLLPANPLDFALYYALGVLGVLVVFTAIIIERSYRGWGVLYAILYVLACTLLVVVPLPLLGTNHNAMGLYPIEVVTIALTAALLVLASAIWLGLRLLRRSISV
ncbi:hypothetical protein IDH44_01645 [Paenibacillus sp. IB182496]|uniref:ABC-2 family transporter n=1 Tax=Paenibacillus sabuli TaxID=2772509 RepID=A0A927BNN5_9BACL|nr:hypothetical protein [Paenibacillus sabuli]MBD2843882.1 hypothetical protein [Paenibacillus sabuli]